MEEKDNNKKQKPGRGKNGLLVALLLLLGGGGYFTGGFGLLNQGENKGGNGSNQAIEQDAVDTITIEESKVLWNGNQITAQELQEKINKLGDQGQVKVVDNKAIKATYESVLEQLDKGKVKVIEVMEQ